MNAVLNNVRTDVVFTDDLTIEIHGIHRGKIYYRAATDKWEFEPTSSPFNSGQLIAIGLKLQELSSE